MNAKEKNTLMEFFGDKISEFNSAVENRLEASSENDKSSWENGDYNYLVSEADINYDNITLCEDLQYLVDKNIATKEEIVDEAINYGFFEPDYRSQCSPFNYGSAYENEIYCIPVPETSDQIDPDSFKEYAPTEIELTYDREELKGWVSGDYFDEYFKLFENKESVYLTYNNDYDIVRFVISDIEGLLSLHEDKIKEAKSKSNVKFTIYDSFDGEIGSDYQKRDLNFVCNGSGDVYCKDCGEPWDRAHILEVLENEEDDFKEIILTQPSDDPHGDNYIQIKAVKGCRCC